MPTLSEIIKQDARYMQRVSISREVGTGAIIISDTTGYREDIYLQGDDADQFVLNQGRVWGEAGDVSMDEVAKHLARPYAESIWS